MEFQILDVWIFGFSDNGSISFCFALISV